jgi:hydrogenase maturation protease
MNEVNEANAVPRVLVLGLGNPVLSDDAAGLAVAEEVRKQLAVRPGGLVEVITSTRAGFELLELMQGYTHAIVIDALDLPYGTPCNVVQLSLDDFGGSPRLNNPHEVNIKTAFEIADRLGIEMPENVVIFGIETADTVTIGEQLTPRVQSAVVPAALEVLDFIKTLELPSAVEDLTSPAARPAFYPPGN